MYVREPEREIEVLDKVDVLVAGAGVSGCAAASLRREREPRRCSSSATVCWGAWPRLG